MLQLRKAIKTFLKARRFSFFSFLFGSKAGRETTESTSSEVSNGYCGDVENLSEHDEVEPTVKQEPTSECEEETYILLPEGIRTNLAK